LTVRYVAATRLGSGDEEGIKFLTDHSNWAIRRTPTVVAEAPERRE